MGNKKLTEKQIKEIIAERIEGASYNSLAKEYRVSVNTIKKYCLSDPDFAQKCTDKKRACADDVLAHMEEKAKNACALIDRLLEELSDPERIKNSGTRELAMAFGIVVDKFGALKGNENKEITITFSDEVKKYAN